MQLAAIACMFLFRHNPATPLVDAHFIDSILMFFFKKEKGTEEKGERERKSKGMEWERENEKKRKKGERKVSCCCSPSLSLI